MLNAVVGLFISCLLFGVLILYFKKHQTTKGVKFMWVFIQSFLLFLFAIITIKIKNISKETLFIPVLYVSVLVVIIIEGTTYRPN